MNPLEILSQAANVPGFHRTETRCCYYCSWMVTNLQENWECIKHDIFFGDNSNNTIALQAEFVCDDFKADE